MPTFRCDPLPIRPLQEVEAGVAGGFDAAGETGKHGLDCQLEAQKKGQARAEDACFQWLWQNYGYSVCSAKFEDKLVAHVT